MLVSTKGRYALRVMIDLTEHNDGSYIPLRDIAGRQEISEKYLESIIASLSRAHLVSGVRGKGGGYRLTKQPADYSVRNILEVTDGPLAPVSCVESGENPCPRASGCKTLMMWSELNTIIDRYFDAVSLVDLAAGRAPAAADILKP